MLKSSIAPFFDGFDTLLQKLRIYSISKHGAFPQQDAQALSKKAVKIIWLIAALRCAQSFKKNKKLPGPRPRVLFK